MPRPDLTGRLVAAIRELRSVGRARTIRRPRPERPESEDAWFGIALVLATAVGVLIAVAGGEALLVSMLAVPPVVACTTTGIRATSVIAGYCLVLAIVLGVSGSDGVHPGQMVVGAIGLLSVWNAAMREGLVARARGGALMGEGLGLLDDILEEGTTVEHVARLAVPEFADVCLVDLIVEDGSIQAAAITARNSRIAKVARAARSGRRIDPRGAHPVAQVIRTGERKVLTRIGDPDLRELAIDNEHLTALRRLQPRSGLIEPLVSNGKTFGAITFKSLAEDERYGAGEIAFAEELARRAAAGIANARQHGRQAHVADTLQRRLLPPALPQIEGLETAARFRPAGTGSNVSGDFYDFFPLGGRSWAVVIGDVCGKGPEAAALTSLTRDTLRASTLRGETPSDALRLLNAAILGARADGRFCTSAYARLDIAPNSIGLTVSNGGHPPPLLLRSDGTVERPAPQGTLLGVYPDPELSDSSIELNIDDAMILYTDGLLGSGADGEPSVESLEELLRAFGGRGAEEIATALEGEALLAQHGEARDDIAILVLRSSNGALT